MSTQTLLTCSDQAKVTIEYRFPGNARSFFESIVVDRYGPREKMVLRSRDKDLALWKTQDLGPAPPIQPLTRQILRTKPIADESPIIERAKSVHVTVHARTPYLTNGAWRSYMRCAGFVINPDVGYVVTARCFMPSTMCNLQVVMADSIELPAVKIYDHNLGFTIIKYDPSLLEGRIGAMTFNLKEPKVQDKLILFGPEGSGGPCLIEVTVQSIGPFLPEYSGRYFYNPINVDIMHMKEEGLGGTGVLLDSNGDVRGLWLPFLKGKVFGWKGVQLSLLWPAFESLLGGSLPPECRMLDMAFEVLCKNDARVFGVSQGIGCPPF